MRLSWDGKAPVIGDDCLIGAGAVVCRNVPDNCTVVSQPARVIAEGREEDDIFEQ